MNAVYIRMIFYVLAPTLAMIPGFTYDSVEGVVTIDIETAAIGFGAALTAVAGVFAVWAKK